MLWTCTACGKGFDHIREAEDHFLAEHGEDLPGEVRPARHEP